MRILKALTAAMVRERGKMTSVPPQRMKPRQTGQHQSGSQAARRLGMLAAGSAGQPRRNKADKLLEEVVHANSRFCGQEIFDWLVEVANDSAGREQLVVGLTWGLVPPMELGAFLLTQQPASRAVAHWVAACP